MTYTIKEDSAGLWCVWCGATRLAEGITLERAIREAGKLARDHHERSDVPVTAVELEIAGTPSLLARYAQPLHGGSESAAA